jgi:curli biogenesis system outer membrane secretion channel CsgG
MKTRITSFLAAAVVALMGTAAHAQDKPGLKTLGLSDPSATKSLKEAATKASQGDSLNRLLESLSEHMVVSFQDTRKFSVVARSDLAKLIDEQNLPKGLVVADDGKALAGKIKGLDYMVVTAVTDFNDQRTGVVIEGLGQRVDRRIIQATAVFKIYNVTTGALMQAVRVPVQQDTGGAVTRTPRSGSTTGGPGDGLVEGAATEMANRGAQQVLNILFPVKVVAVTGNQVTLNRGQGTDIAEGQLWDIFAVGEDLKDPDTGVSLGREEVKVGEIVIGAVLPTMTRGEIEGENRGIAPGAIARPRPARGGRDLPPVRGGARAPQDDRDLPPLRGSPERAPQDDRDLPPLPR